jgi:uncharacterized membrane protein YeaQ/YmgE (transglycosylase-associated protein family)
MALGIAGALLGGFIGAPWAHARTTVPGSTSLIGAVLLLWIYRMMVGRRQRI